ncbi:hypothetical protein BH11CYA1_BH11CYA1_33080 [soil metagenome]
MIHSKRLAAVLFLASFVLDAPSASAKSAVQNLCENALVHSRLMDTQAQALVEVDTAVKMAPRNPMCWYYEAIILEKLEDDKEAYLAIKQALALDPTSAKNLRVEAQILLDLDRAPEALKTIRLALATSDELDARIVLARVFCGSMTEKRRE